MDGQFELVRAPEWSDLVELSRASGLCVIDLSDGLSGDDRTRVLGMRMDRPGLRVVAVVRCGREARQVREAVTDLICVPSDTHVISRTFRAVSYRARRYVLRARVLACDVDEVLREALLHILRQAPGEPGERDLVDPKTLPLRTVKELAREIECDARRLRRAAARHGVELRKALHLWLARGAGAA